MIGAWPRVLELGLGVWLLLAAAALGHADRPELALADRIAGVAVLVIVAAALAPKLRGLHVATVLVALGLIAWSWTTFPRPGPAGAQNQILVGLVLALLAFVPSESNKPPRSWRRYVEGMRA